MHEPFPYEVFDYSATGGWERKSKQIEKQLETEENGNEHRKKIHTAMIKKEKTKRKNVNYMDKNKNKSRYQYI